MGRVQGLHCALSSCLAAGELLTQLSELGVPTDQPHPAFGQPTAALLKSFCTRRQDRPPCTCSNVSALRMRSADLQPGFRPVNPLQEVPTICLQLLRLPSSGLRCIELHASAAALPPRASA